MANARTDFLSKLAGKASEASNLFSDTEALARRYQVLGYADSIVTEDFEGTLADASPEDAKIVIEALNAIDSKLDEPSQTNPDRTLREGLLALAATHR